MILSCGETVLASQAEADEFFLLSEALGMNSKEFNSKSELQSLRDTGPAVDVEEKSKLENTFEQSLQQGTDLVADVDEKDMLDFNGEESLPKTENCDNRNKGAENRETTHPTVPRPQMQDPLQLQKLNKDNNSCQLQNRELQQTHQEHDDQPGNSRKATDTTDPGKELDTEGEVVTAEAVDLNEEVVVVEEVQAKTSWNERAKAEKFSRLQSFIRAGRSSRTGAYPCPLVGCEVEFRAPGSVLVHLCAVHLMAEVQELRRAEVGEASRSGRFECSLCGKCLGSLYSLTLHYGVAHRDLARTSLLKTLLSYDPV